MSESLGGGFVGDTVGGLATGGGGDIVGGALGGVADVAGGFI